MTQPAEEKILDGRHDFDFLFGRWRTRQCKLADPFDQSSGWQEFEATIEAQPILGGLGNCDTLVAPAFPGRGHFEGFTLRLFDSETGLWRIWWASTIGNGQLDEPVVGRFEDRIGHFESDDVVAGRPVRVRYEWRSLSASSCRWEQSFSQDGRKTFETNWIMTGTREE